LGLMAVAKRVLIRVDFPRPDSPVGFEDEQMGGKRRESGGGFFDQEVRRLVSNPDTVG
jgi:hypothetical protein